MHIWRYSVLIVPINSSCIRTKQVSTLACDKVSKGYTGAEIIALCRDAALHAIGEMDEEREEDGVIIDDNIHIGGVPQICMRHLLRSIEDMRPRTTKEMLTFYESFRGRH